MYIHDCIIIHVHVYTCKYTQKEVCTYTTVYTHTYNVYMCTSAKFIQLNEWGCRDGMHHAKNWGNKEIPLYSKDTRTIMRVRNPLPEYVGRGYS